jgi:hypothetical protein
MYCRSSGESTGASIPGRARLLYSDKITELDGIIRQSLASLGQELLGGRWKGRREREVVSLYCFGHLLPCCGSGTILHNPTQIAIEVAVPQIEAGPRHKDQVCKDIVLWPRERMVTWDDAGVASVSPISIIEWKHHKRRVSERDVEWLSSFSEGKPMFVGYAVCSNYPAEGFTLSCTRVALGVRQDRWFHLA